jgi:hypothetical protein
MGILHVITVRYYELWNPGSKILVLPKDAKHVMYHLIIMSNKINTIKQTEKKTNSMV